MSPSIVMLLPRLSLALCLLTLSRFIDCAGCNTIFASDMVKPFVRPSTAFSRISESRMVVDGDGGSRKTSIVSFCPEKCDCNVTEANQLQVVCEEHFDHNFPIAQLRNDVEILKIVPKCQDKVGAHLSFPGDSHSLRECASRRKNSLNIGPNLRHLRLLKVLVIMDSQVPNIGVRTLWGLSGLRVLNLSRNNLTNLVDKNFDGLYSLKELHLDGNYIRSMISASFRHIQQLEILSLRDNLIDELAPRIFYKLRSLRRLDLSGNKLEHIDGGVFKDTPNLETFSCEKCGLFQFTLPEEVELPRLRNLFLAENTFHNLTTGVDARLLVQIQVLDLNRNVLNGLEPLQSPMLETFNAARNNISWVSDCAFCQSLALRDLDLSYNRIARINVDMLPKPMRSLRGLSLAGNWINLNSLELLLNRLPNVEILNLAHTGIVNVPQTLLQGNGEIKDLNLSQNLLIDLEPSIFQHLDNLETLDLSSNFLMGLSSQFFEEVEAKKNLRMVFLQNNQWKCDRCHIIPLLQFLKSSLMYWGSCFSHDSPLCLRCAKPDNLLHFKIQDLSEGYGDAEDIGDDPDITVIPKCEPLFQQIHVGTYMPKATQTLWNTNSPYVALGIMLALALVLVIIFINRYRHYGVYLTHEENQLVNADDELLSNPVVVLDRNSESYINLKYPCIPENGTAGS